MGPKSISPTTPKKHKIRHGKISKSLASATPPTRKELRKQKRKAKKSSKNQFHLTKFGISPPQSQSPKKKRRQKNRKRNRHGKNKNVVNSKGSSSKNTGDSETEPEEPENSDDSDSDMDIKTRDTQITKLQAQMDITRKKRLLEDNQDEEKYISSLGKKLKLNKKAVIPASFRTDGLDYLLEFCDNLDKSKSNKSSSGEGKDEEDPGSDSEMESQSCDDDDESVDGPVAGDEDEAGDSEEVEDSDEELDKVDEHSEEGEALSPGFSEDDEEQDNALESGIWEDIYGRFRDAKGNVVKQPLAPAPAVSDTSSSKYIPPNRRAESNSNSIPPARPNTINTKIHKLLKGLLNRLSESNMHSISSQIESLYMANSRNEMNETLLALISAALIGRVQSSERLILEHTMLIGILHANVGMEIGAFFIQSFIQKFHSLYTEFVEETKRNGAQGEDDTENRKELENLVLLVSYMYHFKIVNSSLIYDILNFLSSSFQPKDIELILTVLRSVGFRLRKDNPLALKSLILNLQEKANLETGKSTKSSSRVKFMLEILLAIRNNNMTKIPNYDPSYGEHLSKTLKAHFHPGNYVSELQISMEDLLNANIKGKWWIVGSAWSGIGQDSEKLDPNQASSLPSNLNTQFQSNQKLLAKAKAQGMNTETRKTIFCILMSAEDYLDGFEKLMSLGLKGNLERELVHVPIYCCLHEKKWNPYYGLLLSKFCGYDRRFMLTAQYSLWDRIKDLSSLSQNQLSNLTLLIVHLVNEKSIPITLLRVIDFSDMDQLKFHFLKEILSGILNANPPETITEIFIKVGLGSEKLSLFRESLALFLGHFMLKGQFVNGEGETISLTNSEPTNSFQPPPHELKSKIKIAEKAMRVGSKRVLL